MADRRETSKPRPPPTTVVSRTGTAYAIATPRNVWLALALNAAPRVASWSYRTRRVELTHAEPFIPDFHVAFVDGTTMLLHTVAWHRRAYRALLQRELDELCPIPAYVLLNREAYLLKRLLHADGKTWNRWTPEQRVRWGIPE